LLTPDIIPIVEKEKIGPGGEIYIIDSVNELAQKGRVYGKFIDGVYHDAGNKLSYIKAVIDHALADKTLGPKLEEYICSRLAQK
ncbi:MAG: UTP--glucose-1-phosphate uridylyltransferase, partial [Candidatus Saccharibacteria bacterium]